MFSFSFFKQNSTNPKKCDETTPQEIERLTIEVSKFVQCRDNIPFSLSPDDALEKTICKNVTGPENKLKCESTQNDLRATMNDYSKKGCDIPNRSERFVFSLMSCPELEKTNQSSNINHSKHTIGRKKSGPSLLPANLNDCAWLATGLTKR